MADLTIHTGTRHTAGVYARAIAAQVRSIVEYPSDFWVMFAAGAMWQVLQFAFLTVLFANVPVVAGWNLHEMMLLTAFLTLATGFPAILCDGFWSTGSLVLKGDMDYRITRPHPVILQVATGHIGLQAFGEITLGLAMLLYGWIGAGVSPVWIPAAVLLLASAVLLEASLFAVLCGLNFWVKGTNAIFAMMMEDLQISTMRLPLGLFPVAVKAITVFIVPVAFVNFVPVAIFTERLPPWWILGPPLVALAVAGAAVLVFRLGLRSYDSAGN